MKKLVSIFTIAAIALTVVSTPAFAKEGRKGSENKENREFKFGDVLRDFRVDFDGRADVAANQFVLAGSVGSTTSGSIVVNVKGSVNVPNVTNGLATVNVDSNTKYSGTKNQTLALADVKTGQQVVMKGTVNGSTLTAQNVFVNVNPTSNQFKLEGTVGSTTSGSIVVNVSSSKNLPTLTNNLATVNVDANTKYKAEKNQTVTLADIKAGQKVEISGTVNGTSLTAQTVKVKLPKGKVFGEVTAKTDTSVTVKNSVTGVTQTITTNADTKVTVNGETKTVTDVQVGDKGFVKFRTTLSGLVAKVINLFR